MVQTYASQKFGALERKSPIDYDASGPPIDGTGVLNMRAQPCVYLAGPILGWQYDEASAWRERAAQSLAPEIACYSPLRGKHLEHNNDSFSSSRTHGLLLSPKGIVTRDRLDMQRCDLVLANLQGATQPSIGTCVEFGWADAYRKPIVTVLPAGAGHPHDHVFIHQLSGYTTTSLDEAIALVRAILLP